MGSITSTESISVDRDGFLIIVTNCIKTDKEGLFYKGEKYKWKEGFELKSNSATNVNISNGDLYINENHWSHFTIKNVKQSVFSGFLCQNTIVLIIMGIFIQLTLSFFILHKILEK